MHILFSWARFTLTFVLLLSAQLTTANSLELVTYYHNDHLGSPVAATDHDGVKLWFKYYTPYGETYQTDSAESSNTRGYTGHLSDSDLGLVYMQARYYDPQIGRFLSIDPVGFHESNPQSFNRYAYANNNPYRYIDPDGNIPVETIADLLFVGYYGSSLAYNSFMGAVTGNPEYDARAAAASVDLGLSVTGALIPYAPAAGLIIAKNTAKTVKHTGRSGKQARLREIMNDPKASSADRGWLKNDARHMKNGNKSGLRLPRNGRKSPGRKAADKGYELAHPYNQSASKGHSYAGAKLKNHADHKVETRLHRKRY